MGGMSHLSAWVMVNVCIMEINEESLRKIKNKKKLTALSLYEPPAPRYYECTFKKYPDFFGGNINFSKNNLLSKHIPLIE